MRVGMGMIARGYVMRVSMGMIASVSTFFRWDFFNFSRFHYLTNLVPACLYASKSYKLVKFSEKLKEVANVPIVQNFSSERTNSALLGRGQGVLWFSSHVKSRSLAEERMQKCSTFWIKSYVSVPTLLLGFCLRIRLLG